MVEITIIIHHEENGSTFEVIKSPKSLKFEFSKISGIVTVTKSDGIQVDLSYGKDFIEHFLAWLNDLKILYSANFGEDANMSFSSVKIGSTRIATFQGLGREVVFTYNLGSNDIKIDHSHAPLSASPETFRVTWSLVRKWISGGFPVTLGAT